MKTLLENYNRFYENLLTEDIAAVKKQYSFIPEEDFDTIISLDPTYTGGNSVGTYGKGLLGLYKKLNGKYPADTTDILKQFDKVKKDRTKEINKDINSYKTFDDIKNAIANVTTKELTDRQKLRARRKSKDYKLLYENDKCWVYTPLTGEGDVTLGAGTNGCTADSREEYGKRFYDEYLQKGGQYYIIIDKEDPEVKYQFHFETSQFKNGDDEPVDDLEGLCGGYDITDFFEQEGYDIEEYEDYADDDDDEDAWWQNEEDTLYDMYRDSIGISLPDTEPGVDIDSTDAQMFVNSCEIAIRDSGCAANFDLSPAEETYDLANILTDIIFGLPLTADPTSYIPESIRRGRTINVDILEHNLITSMVQFLPEFTISKNRIVFKDITKEKLLPILVSAAMDSDDVTAGETINDLLLDELFGDAILCNGIYHVNMTDEILGALEN